MARISYSYLGSFQKGIDLRSEAPMNEVWSHFGLYGSEEYLRENVTEVQDADAIADYVAVRIRQSIELRDATRNSTMLTAPLALYYSILNLTRACMAIRDELLVNKAHGLIFKTGDEIRTCAAKVVDGTFSQYLKSAGTAPKNGVEISLDDCLARIIESSGDYFTVAGKPSLVSPVSIRADSSGTMTLAFNEQVVGLERFRSSWESDYPSLAPLCELESTGCVLRVKEEIKPKSLDDVSLLCGRMLEIDLVRRSDPIWFAVRNEHTDFVWPRAAYYFAALFILGNIVRYQPELMYPVISGHSKWAWMLRRFIVNTERFYPNLLFNWIHNVIYFFG